LEHDVKLKELDLAWVCTLVELWDMYPTLLWTSGMMWPLKKLTPYPLEAFFTQQPPLKTMLEDYFIIFGHFLAYVGKNQIIWVKVNVKT
jgi:hypothetical protein